MDGQKNMVNASEKLSAVRQMMAEHNIAALVVPSADPHQSEYVTGHWQARAWLTGFTGVAVVTKDKAILWTDFRYWIQALSQACFAGHKSPGFSHPVCRAVPEGKEGKNHTSHGRIRCPLVCHDRAGGHCLDL